MKNIYLLLGVLLSAVFVQAQVTITPTFATQNDSVTITFDASQGNGELVNTVPVYAHTGVITNASTSPTDWKNVQGNWGSHDPNVIMTAIGNNKHQMSFKIDDFYQLGPNDTVYQLAFVFRNGDGSKVGRDVNGDDIYVPIYSSGFSASILSPVANALLPSTDSTLFEVATSDTAQISLFVNGSQVGNTVNATNAQHMIQASQLGVGQHILSFNAVYNGQTVSDSVQIVVYGAPTVVDPPAGTQLGINITGPNSVVLQLFAPHKDFVYAVGDFSDWQIHPDYFMHMATDSATFWVELTGLDADSLYRFQYQVNAEAMRIADAYSSLILNPWDDPYIGDTTYPNLPEYPTQHTSGNVATFQINQAGYAWQNDAYQAPAKENLIIYELLIRDFVHQHDYATLLDSLNYLANLGVNAIELLPVNEFEGNESWGYNPAFYFAPDKYYGPAVDFKTFVDSCHGRGIAVILDMALNHSFGQSPMVQMWFNPNAGQWGEPSAENPYFNQQPKHDFNVGYDMNHESPHSKAFTKRVLNYWLDEFHIDGYRMDLSKGFTQKNTLGNINAWNNYDATRIAIWQDYGQSVWNNHPNAFMILEHFADNDEEKELSDNGFMLWGNLNHDYNEATMGYPSDLSWGSYKARGWDDAHLVTFSSSHDEERLMYKNLQYGNSNGSYNVKDLHTGLSRVEAANVMLYALPGPKMLWQFDEVGYDYSINHCPDGTIDPDCRVSNKPIRWDYINDSARVHLYNATRAMMELKGNYEVFSTSNFQISLSGMQKRIVLQHSSMNVVALANFDVKQGSIAANFTQTGWWYNYFSGDSINVTDVNQSISLTAGEYQLWTDEKLPTPDLNKPISTHTPLGMSEFAVAEKASFSLYPNPAKQQITIQVKKGEFDTFTVYSLNGQQVWSGRLNGASAQLISLPTQLRNGMYVFHATGKKSSATQLLVIGE